MEILDCLYALGKYETSVSYFKRQRLRLLSQLRAICVDRDLGKKGFKRNYDDLLRFFPEVDLQRIEAIEGFHKQLAGILKKEFSETEEDNFHSYHHIIHFSLREMVERVRSIRDWSYLIWQCRRLPDYLLLHTIL